MNPRALLSFLEAKSPKFLPGSGRPTLTPEDVAGALGFIRDPFHRETLCMLYWPAAATIKGRDYHAEFSRRVKDAYWATVRACIEAEFDLEMGRLGHTDPFTMRRLEARAQATKDLRWPAWSRTYMVIPDAVVTEISRPNHCTTCDGHGHFMRADKRIDCPECHGAGTVAVSNRQRARWLGIGESRYREQWWRPYEWAYGLARDAEQQAAEEMGRALAA